MTIKTTNCGDCPFRQSNYNPDSMGYDTIDYCIAPRIKELVRKSAYNIAVYDSWDEENQPDLSKTLTDCPLKQGEIIVKLEENGNK